MVALFLEWRALGPGSWLHDGRVLQTLQNQLRVCACMCACKGWAGHSASQLFAALAVERTLYRGEGCSCEEGMMGMLGSCDRTLAAGFCLSPTSCCGRGGSQVRAVTRTTERRYKHCRHTHFASPCTVSARIGISPPTSGTSGSHFEYNVLS